MVSRAGAVPHPRHRSLWIHALGGLAAVTLVAGGCGGGGDSVSDEEAIRGVAEEFAAAANARDWGKACDLFTPDALAQAESLGVSCEQSFEQRNSPDEQVSDISVTDIQVDGDQATAVLKATNSVEGPSESTQSFEKVDGEWKMGLAGTGTGSP